MVWSSPADSARCIQGPRCWWFPAHYLCCTPEVSRTWTASTSWQNHSISKNWYTRFARCWTPLLLFTGESRGVAIRLENPRLFVLSLERRHQRAVVGADTPIGKGQH